MLRCQQCGPSPPPGSHRHRHTRRRRPLFSRRPGGASIGPYYPRHGPTLRLSLIDPMSLRAALPRVPTMVLVCCSVPRSHRRPTAFAFSHASGGGRHRSSRQPPFLLPFLPSLHSSLRTLRGDLLPHRPLYPSCWRLPVTAMRGSILECPSRLSTRHLRPKKCTSSSDPHHHPSPLSLCCRTRSPGW